MFITYFLIISTLILLFCASIYIWGNTSLKAQAKSDISGLSSTYSQALSNQVGIMDSVSLNVVYLNLVKQTFSDYITLGKGRTDVHSAAEKLYNTKQLTDVLMGILGPNMPVKQINLYDFNGHMFATGTYNTDIQYSFHNRFWYREVLSNAGKKYITSPHEDMQVSKLIDANLHGKYISLCREYYDKNYNPQGIVEIEQDYNTLFSILKNSGTKREQVYVFNTSGDIIYPDNLSPKEAGIYSKYYAATTSQKGIVTITNSLTKQSDLLSYVKSDDTGWTTVVAISEQAFLQPIYFFSLAILLSTIALLALAFFLSFLTAKKITAPISKLRRTVKNIDYNAEPSDSIGELNSGFIELEELNHAFIRMDARVKKSVEEAMLSHQSEMQSRILALQSKMNPHFLFNTLSIINAMAEEEMCKQIKSICMNVSDMLRYISSDTSLITLDNEIQYIDQYIACIKYFYGDKLSYSIEVDRAMYTLKIPKLLVQPLVENAVKHGTKNTPPWTVAVKGFIKDGLWQIDVLDNGSGFDLKKLYDLNQKIREIDKTGLLPSLEIEGMGLLNTYIRLKMQYGNETIFHIENVKTGGSKVSIGGNI
jgi:two-component system, sensor histidine kinase YesM